MLATLPLLLIAAVFVLILQNQRSITNTLAFLRAISVVGFYAVIILEVLNLWSGITQVNLVISWIVPLLIILVLIVYRRKNGFELRFPQIILPSERFQVAGIVIIIMILLCTALVAWYAPPQTWDSLNYRMSRVAHWAQNQSLRPFATGIEIQNSNLPGAEMLFLHAYVLANGDRFVNLVQWLAMIGSVCATGFIASLLGGKRTSIVLTVVFAVTLPMGIIEASSTMNDYVVAVWVTCFVVEVILFAKSKGLRGSLTTMAMNFGLAMITKPIAFAYLLPFLTWAIVVTLVSSVWKSNLRTIFIGVLLVGFMNVPHYGRTYQIYGQLIDPNQIETHANTLRTIPGLISNTLRNFSLHLGTPSPHLNKAINLTIRKIHQWIGLSVNDSRTTAHADFKVSSPTTNEIKAGNPLHMYCYLLALVLIYVRRKDYERTFFLYIGLTLSSMFIFSFMFKWQLFGSRYHMPFFILISPIIGVVFSNFTTRIIRWTFLVVFFVLSLPWLLSIQSRPIIPRDWTVSKSILFDQRELMYFGDVQALAKPYEQVADHIRSNNCHSIGIALAGHTAEYPFWVFLGSPSEDVVIEWIVDGSPSSKFRDQSFDACAIICDFSCPREWEVVNGLPLAYEVADYRLFMED